MNKELETFGNKVCPKNCIANCEECEFVAKKLKALNSIKECCEFDFIKIENNDKPTRYEIHIRRKGGDNIFFPCLAIYPKSQDEFDLFKEVLKY